MIKKTLLATATSAALLGPLAASAAGDMGQGTITFTGSVTEAPCSITGADTNLTINLGQISKKTLTNATSYSPSVPLEIHLNGCQFGAATGTPPAQPLSKVSVKFPGQTGTNGSITNTGSATNVSIQLLNADNNTPVNFTTGSTDSIMHDGAGNTLSLFARMMGSAAGAGAGTVTAKVTYMLDYK